MNFQKLTRNSETSRASIYLPQGQKEIYLACEVTAGLRFVTSLDQPYSCRSLPEDEC